MSDEYIDMLTHHFIYKNDETSLANYCASITMYPWLIGGTTSIGGNSTAPTNLKSFCGGFVNMVFMVSSMLSGACATPEFLMYMNYFIGKEYGTDYYKDPDRVVDLSLKQRTIDKVITDYFEQIVYSLNQPTGARNYQAVFWNVAYYDRPYFERESLRRILLPRWFASRLGRPLLAAEALHEVVQQGAHEDRAHLPRRDHGAAHQGWRLRGQGVGRLHG